MKCLTYVVLDGVKKSPGDTVTAQELADAGQTNEDIERLVADGALGEDDTELHPDHQPLAAPKNMSGHADATDKVDGDSAEGVTKSA